MSAEQQAASTTTVATPPAAAGEERIWHEGSCHCGAVAYKVLYPALDSAPAPAAPGTPADFAMLRMADSGLPVLQQPARGYACNCSICRRNGYISLYVQRADVVFTRGGLDALAAYRFNRRMADHRFCAACGSSCFVDLKGNILEGDVLAVNARMLDDFNIHTIKYNHAA